jgi:hypothetical protein
MELLEHLIQRHPDVPLGRRLNELRGEIEEDQMLVRDVLRRLGAAESSTKKALGWVTEKLTVARRSVSLGYEPELATFEELETLAIGVQGKLAMWRALAIVASSQPALRMLDFPRLEQRASDQHERLEALRLGVANAALKPVPSEMSAPARESAGPNA